MKKYLNIALALALILAGLLGYGRNRPRTLDQCFPEGTWEQAVAAFFVPKPGEPEELFTLSMTPEELKTTMEDITVFRRPKINSWNCAYISLNLQIDGRIMAVGVGEDGSVAICDADDFGDWVCWRAPDGELYQAIVRAR